MAKRRRFAGVRRAARRVYAGARRVGRRAYRRASHSASRTSMTMLSIGFSFGYGAARGWITGLDLVKKGMSMIPFGGAYKDNIFFGGLAVAIAYLLKPANALVKLGLATIAHNEAFLAGAKMQAGYSLTDSSSSSAQVASSEYL